MGLQFSSDEIQSPVKTSSSQSSFENARRETGALSLKDRAKAAIVGAFVADSLSSYSSNCDENDETKFLSNFEEQEQIFGTHNKVEPSPHSGHLGHQSFYGEEAFPFLRIISTRGYFESTDACEEAFQLLTVFKEKDSAHLNVHPLMKEFYDRRIEGCSWVDCSCRNDLNFLSITKVPILVARYAGSPFLLSKVEDAVRIYQTNPKVLAACRLSAILLEKVVLGYSVSDALQWAIESAERKNKPSSGGSKERNSISNLSVQNQFSLITLDENEIEFLYAILPIPEKIPYMHSNYGSCQTLDPAFQNNSDINESSRGDSKYDCQSDTYGSELRMEVGGGMKKSGSKNKISRNSSGNSTGSNGSTDPSGAFNYYLQKNRNNGNNNNDNNNNNSNDNNSNNTQSNKEINGRPIHRRLLCGGMSGINGSRSVPFSSAVEQIGLSAQLPESLQASLYGLHIFRSYETAVRANIMTGGDNVCRSWLIGAMFAAEQGESCIPTEWTQQTLLHSQIVTMADRLAGSNPYFETLKEKGCNISVLLS